MDVARSGESEGTIETRREEVAVVKVGKLKSFEEGRGRKETKCVSIWDAFEEPNVKGDETDRQKRRGLRRRASGLRLACGQRRSRLEGVEQFLGGGSFVLGDELGSRGSRDQ